VWPFTASHFPCSISDGDGQRRVGYGPRPKLYFWDREHNLGSIRCASRYNRGMLINKGGSTVHVVPVEGGSWGVVDPRRRLLRTTPLKAAALDFAKSVAAANQPSQVVLLDEFGRLVPIAHYQLPQYPPPQFGDQVRGSVFEGAVKALLIGGLMAAGIAVLGDVVERVDRDLKKEASKSKRGSKGR